MSDRPPQPPNLNEIANARFLQNMTPPKPASNETDAATDRDEVYAACEKNCAEIWYNIIRGSGPAPVPTGDPNCWYGQQLQKFEQENNSCINFFSDFTHVVQMSCSDYCSVDACMNYKGCRSNDEVCRKDCESQVGACYDICSYSEFSNLVYGPDIDRCKPPEYKDILVPKNRATWYPGGAPPQTQGTSYLCCGKKIDALVEGLQTPRRTSYWSLLLNYPKDYAENLARGAIASNAFQKYLQCKSKCTYG